ncbi:winged helix DNA-binding domain-containing protein [Phytomonospora sp. NPDC050363]|uniref:winged helix DNA-binding domain-containing protein n=1 Tax=Phytomonospora sp. NPDC050363 TaxID=3155642 RepID=UPI0033F0B59B
MTVLTGRTLNRTALARQLLTERAGLDAVTAVERLAGLQGQEANSPYLSLWARLEGFGQAELTAALEDRRVVRSSVLRGTQHLVTAGDFVWMRPLVQPLMARIMKGGFGRDLAGVDLDELTALTRETMAGRTLTRPRLRDELLVRWPGVAPIALAYAAQALVPMIHPPPNGTWNRGGATPFTLAEEWLGRPLSTEPSRAALVERYLRAFGPASVKDVQTWSGLTRLKEVVAGMDLRAYRDESGRELFDVPDGELSEVDEVPVRLLPYFDNLIVAYDDRSRLMSAEIRKRVCVGAVIYPTVLVDGRVRAMWDLVDKRHLRVETFGVLPGRDKAAVRAEAESMLEFMGLAGGEVVFAEAS